MRKIYLIIKQIILKHTYDRPNCFILYFIEANALLVLALYNNIYVREICVGNTSREKDRKRNYDGLLHGIVGQYYFVIILFLCCYGLLI